MLHSVIASYVIFFLVGILGILLHWAKRLLKEETLSSFCDYYFVHHRKYTVVSFLAFVGGMIGLITSGMPLLSLHALISAFTTGYMADSLVNKDKLNIPASLGGLALMVANEAGEQNAPVVKE